MSFESRPHRRSNRFRCKVAKNTGRRFKRNVFVIKTLFDLVPCKLSVALGFLKQRPKFNHDFLILAVGGVMETVEQLPKFLVRYCSFEFLYHLVAPFRSSSSSEHRTVIFEDYCTWYTLRHRYVTLLVIYQQ